MRIGSHLFVLIVQILGICLPIIGNAEGHSDFGTCEARMAAAGKKPPATVEEVETYWQYLKTLPTVHTDLYFNNRNVVRGLPDSVRRLSPEEISKIVFRHYTRTDRQQEILESSSLKAGKTPYVMSPFVYVDLQGVFLTTPDYKAKEIGLDKTFSTWMDLKLDPKLVVLKIESGIFVVPGPAQPPDWIMKSKDSISSSDLDKWKVFGWHALEVPIKIEKVK